MWGNKASQAAWLFLLVFSGLMQPLSHTLQLSHKLMFSQCQQVRAPLSLKRC